jgi:hypothetical protein
MVCQPADYQKKTGEQQSDDKKVTKLLAKAGFEPAILVTN